MALTRIKTDQITDGEVKSADLDTDITLTGDLNVTDITMTGELNGPATFYIDPAPHDPDTDGATNGLVVIRGDLQVDGTTTTVNSTTMDVADLNITLASGAANAAAADGAGLTVDGASATLLYDGTNDLWQFNKNIKTDVGVTIATAAPSFVLQDATGTYNHKFRLNGSNSLIIERYDGSSTLTTLKLDETGDVGFYENNGGTPQVGMHWDYADGRLGIGTTTPNATLVVSTNGAQGIEFFPTAASGVATTQYYNRSGAAYVRNRNIASDHTFNISGATDDAVTIATTGNVGIGTDSPNALLDLTGVTASSSPILRFTGTGNASPGDVIGQIEFYNSDDTDNTAGIMGKIRAIAGPSGGEGHIQFLTDMPSEGADAATVALHIHSTGRVGIGEDAPNQSLVVDHTGHGVGFGYVSSIPDAPGGVYSTAGGSTYPFNEYGNLILKTRTDYNVYDIIMMTASTNGSAEIRMVIKDNGRVGVGGITDPVQDFEVQGSIGTNQVRHSIAPTLNLDFANSKQLDPRITFYRDSIATYYDSKGVLRYANTNEPRFDHEPATGESKGLLIEEARNFLNTNTVTINGGYWGFSNATASVKQAVAPDGTYSADGIRANTVNDGHGIYKAFTTSANTYYTLTAYFKRGANRYAQIAWYYNEAAGNTNYPIAYFDLDDGTFSHTSGINRGTTMTDVGNGWYRCSVTTLSDATPGTSYFYANSATASGTAAYVGTNAIDTYYWGLQIETGPFPTSYVPSDTRFTSRSSVATYYDENGILRTAPANSPRYGYSSPYATEQFGLISTTKYKIGSTEPERRATETGLILENAATNLEDYSYNMDTTNHGQFLSAGGSFAVTSEVAAPDGSYTASKFVFAGGNDRMDDQHGAHNQGTYTLSMWVKGVAGEVVGVSLLNDQGGNVEPYILLTGEWQRISVTKTFDSQGTQIRTHGVIIRGAPGVGVYATSDDGGLGTLGTWANYVYVWGMQVEAGFTATSYIPTFGGTATRTADVASSVAYTRERDYAIGYNLDKLLPGINEGSSVNMSAYTETSGIAHNTGFQTVGYLEDTSDFANNYIQLFSAYGGNNTIATAYNIGGTAANFGNWTSTASDIALNWKIAIGIEDGSQAAAANGTLGTLRSNSIPSGTFDILYIGNGYAGGRTMNGHIKKLSFYDQKLSNAELQALTENN